jgi:hypothetical protein
MNLGTRNNNYLNIRYNTANAWKGQIGQEKGFCTFDTVEHGLRAGRKILLHYLDAGYNTIDKIINRFAPPSENDTEKYINDIYEWTGMPKDEPVDRTAGLQALIRAMSRKETGNTPTDVMIAGAWED